MLLEAVDQTLCVYIFQSSKERADALINAEVQVTGFSLLLFLQLDNS